MAKVTIDETSALDRYRAKKNAVPLLDWMSVARPNQLLPFDRTYVAIRAGRGWGKTATVVQHLLRRVKSGASKRIILLAPTLDDIVRTMLEGKSGIITVFPPELITKYNRTKPPQVFLANGGVINCFTADSPERLRGPESDTIWFDEPGAVVEPDNSSSNAIMALDNALLGFRIGSSPQCFFTYTPKPGKPILRKIENLPNVHMVTGTTYENLPNLTPEFRQTIISQYEGTRLGRQELEGIVVEEVDGALWKTSHFDCPDFRVPAYRPEFAQEWNRRNVEPLVKIVVAVDPTVEDPGLRANPYKQIDECGIIVVGQDKIGRGYVLADLSLRAEPAQWARVVVGAFNTFRANSIIYEKNQGGLLVRDALRTIAPNAPIQRVLASKGKRVRAEPVSLLYDQGRVHHAGTASQFAKLEDEMLSWNAMDPRAKSPNRVDALVYGFFALGLISGVGIRRHRMGQWS